MNAEMLGSLVWVLLQITLALILLIIILILGTTIFDFIRAHYFSPKQSDNQNPDQR